MAPRERDDTTVKDILSQLISQDKTVLEEVRKIALRGLSESGNNNNQIRQRTGVEESARADFSHLPNSSKKTVENNTNTYVTPESKSTPLSEGDDGEELAFTVSKDSDTYRNIFSTVRWYRDSFFIGTAYADQRSVERNQELTQNNTVENNKQQINMVSIGSNIRKDALERTVIQKSDPSTAISHPLLLSSAENYLKSIAAVDLLRPYATWVVSSEGPMLQTATQSLAQSIPLAQSSCDWAMRENLLWVLKDEEWREFAKSITTTYVDRSTRMVDKNDFESACV